MSCYFRHLKGIFAEAGVEVTSENRRRIDLAIHQSLGLADGEDGPVVWKKLKQEVMGDEAKRSALARKVREATNA